jgi:adenosine kinase
MFDGEALKAFIAQATWVAVNDYEGRMLCERTGLSLEALSSMANLKGVIVTLGADGCDVWVQGRCERVPGVAAEQVLDPTGCGDAFRAALLHGLERGWPLVDCVRLGNRLGALKIAQRGGQNHVVDRVALGLA